MYTVLHCSGSTSLSICWILWNFAFQILSSYKSTRSSWALRVSFERSSRSEMNRSIPVLVCVFALSLSLSPSLSISHTCIIAFYAPLQNLFRKDWTFLWASSMIMSSSMQQCSSLEKGLSSRAFILARPHLRHQVPAIMWCSKLNLPPLQRLHHQLVFSIASQQLV